MCTRSVINGGRRQPNTARRGLCHGCNADLEKIQQPCKYGIMLASLLFNRFTVSLRLCDHSFLHMQCSWDVLPSMHVRLWLIDYDAPRHHFGNIPRAPKYAKLGHSGLAACQT